MWITYAGGSYLLDPQDPPAAGSVSFDLRGLRDQGVADRNGQALPPTVMSGQFGWSILQSQGVTKLNGRAEIVSALQATSRSYSCGVCCPNSFYDGFLRPGPLPILPGSVGDAEILARYQNCSGVIIGPVGAYANSWWIQAPSVTGVSTVQTGLARANGYNEGDSSVDGTWPDEHWNIEFDELGNESCVMTQVTGGSPGNVAVNVCTGGGSCANTWATCNNCVLQALGGCCGTGSGTARCESGSFTVTCNSGARCRCSVNPNGSIGTCTSF